MIATGASATTSFFDASTIVALIALLGSIASAMFSYTSAKRSLYVNAVTVERTKWVDNIRRNLADYLGCLGAIHLIVVDSGPDGFEEHRARIAELVEDANDKACLIELQINPDGRVDQNVVELLNLTPRLIRAEHGKDFFAASQLLVRHSQYLLKFEWERIKIESASWWQQRKLLESEQRRVAEYVSFSQAEGSVARLAAVVATL